MPGRCGACSAARPPRPPCFTSTRLLFWPGRVLRADKRRRLSLKAAQPGGVLLVFLQCSLVPAHPLGTTAEGILRLLLSVRLLHGELPVGHRQHEVVRGIATVELYRPLQRGHRLLPLAGTVMGHAARVPEATDPRIPTCNF